MSNYLEPRQIISILLRWWWVLVLVPLIAIALGFVISKAQTPIYQATTTVMVGGFIQSPQINRDDIVARDAFTQAYAEMALRQPVLDGAVKALDLNISWRQLGGLISVEVVGGTPLIEIKAKASSTSDAQAIAAEIANQLIMLSQTQDEEDSRRQFVQQEIDNLQVKIGQSRERLSTLQEQATKNLSQVRLDEIKSETDTLERTISNWEDTYSRLLTSLQSTLSQNRLTIIEDAHANPEPVSPRLNLNLVLSAFVGFGLAIGVIFVIDLFDERIKSSKVLERKLGVKHLGTIKKMKGKDYDGKLVATQDPLFGSALFYRKILHNIGFDEKGNLPVKSLLVTSPRLREGKSVTVSNLGIVTAQAGLKTVIVDVDWKDPIQHQLFNVKNETGLMDLLTDSDLITKDQLHPTGIPNLKIITTGTVPVNPDETFDANRMKQILSDLAKVSDVVILDSPSAVITESSVLFGLVDGVILVIDSSQTTITSIKQSLTSLYLTGGNLLGGILNRSPSWNIS